MVFTLIYVFFKWCHITGKMNRGLMVVVSLCHLVGDRPLTAEEERLAFILGWCIEMVSDTFVLCDCIRSNEFATLYPVLIVDHMSSYELTTCTDSRSHELTW